MERQQWTRAPACWPYALRPCWHPSISRWMMTGMASKHCPWHCLQGAGLGRCLSQSPGSSAGAGRGVTTSAWGVQDEGVAGQAGGLGFTLQHAPVHLGSWESSNMSPSSLANIRYESGAGTKAENARCSYNSTRRIMLTADACAEVMFQLSDARGSQRRAEA